MFLVENDQIGLSPVLPSDRERFFYLQQDPDINRYIRVPEPDEMVETFLTALIKPWDQQEHAWHGLGLREKNSAALCGLIFYRYKNKFAEVLELGWKLHPDVWGKGYATAGARLMMQYLSENYPVHKYVAFCDSENGASERIMQKLGMHKEGYFKADYKIGDEWRDDLAYGLVCD
jgi:RimJ/RimL family protein N-acetyltransferase